MQINAERKTGRADKALGWLVQIPGRSRVLGVIYLCILLHNPVRTFGAVVPPGQSVTLSWQESNDPNITGYNIYYGVASHTYTKMINVGNVTKATVFGLAVGVTYYFAATAYDSLEAQSDYSNEASYTVPTVVSKIQIHGVAGGQFMLTVTGPVGHTYEIQATQDFKIWTTIGTATIGVGGSLDFTDTNAVNFSQRYYHTCDTQP